MTIPLLYKGKRLSIMGQEEEKVMASYTENRKESLALE